MSDTEQKPECPKSEREDKKHSWHFDGDDPYVICYYCGTTQDAISGKPISSKLHDSVGNKPHHMCCTCHQPGNTPHCDDCKEFCVPVPVDGELREQLYWELPECDESRGGFGCNDGIGDFICIRHRSQLDRIEQLFDAHLQAAVSDAKLKSYRAGLNDTHPDMYTKQELDKAVRQVQEDMLDSLIAQTWLFANDEKAVPTRYLEAELRKLNHPTKPNQSGDK